MKDKMRRKVPLLGWVLGPVLFLMILLGAFGLAADKVTAESVSSIDITRLGPVYEYGYDGEVTPGYNASAKFTSNVGSGVAYCGSAAIPSPHKYYGCDTYTFDKVAEEENEEIKKVLYYGWKGPGQWEGFAEYGKYYPFGGTAASSGEEACGICVTSMVLSDLYGKSPYSYDMAGKQYFVDFVRGQDKAPEGFTVYRCEAPASDMQSLFTWSYTPKPPKGKAYIQKKPSLYAAVAEICPEQYALAGAVYELQDASGQRVCSLTTGEDGKTQEVEVDPGTYGVRETVAPKGFLLNPKTYTLIVRSEETSLLEVEDKPCLEPLDFRLYKRDPEGAKSGALKGAEYAVQYYKEYLAEEEIKTRTPFRRWIFRTDEEGRFAMEEAWKAGGDDFFYDDEGKPAGLRGTYTFEEIKAPAGYVKNDGIVAIRYLGESPYADTGGRKEALEAAQGEPGGSTGATEVDKEDLPEDLSPHAVIDEEKAIRVNIRKIGLDENMVETDIPGARLQLLDEKGTIVHEWVSSAEGEVIRALAAGRYRIRELEAPAGYRCKGEDVEIVVEAVDAMQTFSVMNRRSPTLETEATIATEDAQSDAMVAITDRVRYKHLEKGTTYQLQAVLMDKATGLALEDEEGRPLEKEMSFTAEGESGTIIMTFRIPRRLVEGKTLVVFENLLEGEEKVAAHEDLYDSKQTVSIPEKPKSGKPPRTGDPGRGIFHLALLLCAGSGLVCLFRKRCLD